MPIKLKSNRWKRLTGPSTRCKHKELPKYIHYSNTLGQPFRVVKKDRRGYRSWYFKDLTLAVKFSRRFSNSLYKC